MTHFQATDEQLSRFEEDGFLVVEQAITGAELQALNDMASEVVRRRHELARDWDWRREETRERRAFRIVQANVTSLFPWLQTSRFRLWATDFSASLMRQPMEHWYDQFLGKPPRIGAPTPWHQDEGYWGRRLFNRGITCWMSFHDVSTENGCMHFVRGGHREVLVHRNPSEMASDSLVCEPAKDAEVVVCPLNAGDVTFHHSKMPHSTTGNSSERWRMTLAQHFWNPECKTQPEDNYDWRVHVDQAKGERVHVASGELERVL